MLMLLEYFDDLRPFDFFGSQQAAQSLNFSGFDTKVGIGAQKDRLHLVIFALCGLC